MSTYSLYFARFRWLGRDREDEREFVSGGILAAIDNHILDSIPAGPVAVGWSELRMALIDCHQTCGPALEIESKFR